jgi:phosphomannomutase
VQHGVHLTAQFSLHAVAVVDVMSRLRSAPPEQLAGHPVTAVTDYSGGSRDLPSADMLAYQLPGARVLIRPSGTEPKVKIYLEVVELVTGRTLLAARQEAAARMAGLRAAVTDLLG